MDVAAAAAGSSVIVVEVSACDVANANIAITFSVVGDAASSCLFLPPLFFG
jgi:hypothetical protein